MNFITTIKQFFEANEDVIYGQKQSNYLKNNFPCYGIQTIARREILKHCTSVFKEDIKFNFREICWKMYQYPHREMHQAAIDIFIKKLKTSLKLKILRL
jgi:3-methyladenine DNA glycosylase AlkD